MPSETLVMIPPMLCDARIFEPQIRALGSEHAVMFAPTTKGERMEEIASQILSWAPSKFALAGMGMGGMVAMEILRRAPERVTRIALISTSPLAETPQTASLREPQIIAARAGRWADVLQHEIHSTWMSPNVDKAAFVRLLTVMGNALGPEVYVKQARALQRRKDLQSELRKIAQPALVICGRHDGHYPVKRHETMAELIPYCDIEVIEDAGYLPTIEAPESVTAALSAWMRRPLMLRN